MSLQRYDLGRPLGRGGQGHTYRARDRESEQDVAVKVMHLSGGGGWKAFDLFERECAVLRSLEHHGIPRYLDSFGDDAAGRYYLVMQLVQGVSLRELMSRGETLAEAQLWNVLHQLLEILEYLHGRSPPVIHRDVKPANIIRRPDNTFALVDFGGVRLALRPDGGSTVVGTFGYMAPEQLHGDATPATDIYGLGATIAALATGQEADKLPRRGLEIDLEAVMTKGALRRLLAKMLAPDPDQRLASVAEVRAAMAAPARRPTRRERRAARRRERREARRQRAREWASAGATAPDASESPPQSTTPDDETRPRDEGDDVKQVIVRLIGSLGYLGLLLIDRIGLPLLFFVLSALSSPQRRPALVDRRRRARAALESGRDAMKRLSEGRPRKQPPQLPPHEGS